MITNSFKEIGGYFGLEFEEKTIFPRDVVALNDARNCLRYVIQAFNIKEIHLPYYTCPVVWQAIQKENCKINFYHIDKNFMPAKEFNESDFIVYTNYFGVCAGNVKKLAGRYKNLIVDNAQAFYMPKYGIASFNSIRKFFGVSDGAFLYTDKKLNTEFDKDTSYQRFSHLLKRTDVSANFGYQDFCTNDISLEDEEIKTISNLTKQIFLSIDIEDAKQKRLMNFEFLHKKLADKNELQIKLDSEDVPLAYPFLIRKEGLRRKLIENKIYVAQYWSPMPQEYEEGMFQKYILPLPIDQRYNIEDMRTIIEVIDNA